MIQHPVTPEDYRTLFEHTPLGVRILEDLWAKFARPPVTEGGIDAVLKTFTRAGERNVLEHIVRKINQANQVPDVGPDNEE